MVSLTHTKRRRCPCHRGTSVGKPWTRFGRIVSFYVLQGLNTSILHGNQFESSLNWRILSLARGRKKCREGGKVATPKHKIRTVEAHCKIPTKQNKMEGWLHRFAFATRPCNLVFCGGGGGARNGPMHSMPLTGMRLGPYSSNCVPVVGKQVWQSRGSALPKVRWRAQAGPHTDGGKPSEDP